MNYQCPTCGLSSEALHRASEQITCLRARITELEAQLAEAKAELDHREHQINLMDKFGDDEITRLRAEYEQLRNNRV
jgi:uncharacterized protein involved in exopolysaccharide biosynthesis